MNIVDGVRQGAADAYLVPAMDRANLDVIGDALVRRVRIEDGRCVAMDFVVDGDVKSVRVERAAVLCAGSIGSPQQLQLSGIGPADHLRGLGIDVVVDLPGVGQNLQDHVQSRVVYSAIEPLHTASNGFCQVAAMLRGDLDPEAAPDVCLMLIDFPAGPRVADSNFGARRRTRCRPASGSRCGCGWLPRLRPVAPPRLGRLALHTRSSGYHQCISTSVPNDDGRRHRSGRTWRVCLS